MICCLTEKNYMMNSRDKKTRVWNITANIKKIPAYCKKYENTSPYTFTYLHKRMLSVHDVITMLRANGLLITDQ